jgi:hypothetical protein
MFKKANWSKYMTTIGEKSKQQINSYEDFETILQTSANVSIPRSNNTDKNRNVTKHPYKFWWNEECAKATKARKEATKQFLRLGNAQTFLELKRQTAVAKNTIRKTKKDAFKNFCSSISRQTSISTVWDKVKAFNKGKSRLACDPAGKLDLEEYADYLCPPTVPTKEEIEPPDLTNELDKTHHQPFSMEELKLALSQTKDSTTGQDDISYSMLKNLTPEATEKLL